MPRFSLQLVAAAIVVMVCMIAVMIAAALKPPAVSAELAILLIALGLFAMFGLARLAALPHHRAWRRFAENHRLAVKEARWFFVASVEGPYRGYFFRYWASLGNSRNSTIKGIEYQLSRGEARPPSGLIRVLTGDAEIDKAFVIQASNGVIASRLKNNEALKTFRALLRWHPREVTAAPDYVAVRNRDHAQSLDELESIGDELRRLLRIVNADPS